ncbi:MAG: MFS transporter [Thermodesulfobacteriota bacterium]
MSNERTGFTAPKPGLFGWYREINSDQWKAFIAAFLGWTLDAMDLLLFAFAVSSIAEVFSLSPSQVGTIFSVTLFSSAFGGAVFGIVSDYIGRVRALTYTILVYSLFTGLSAFSPTVWFLIVCRLFLGLGMGGEWASGEVLVAESWPKQHRGKVIGMVQSGWAVGYILAAILATLIIPSFDVNVGWRILFLVGITPAFLVFYIRRHLDEPEIWQKTADMRKEGKLGEKGQSFTLGQIFRRDLIRYTITATVLTSLCMIAYWGLYFWIPQFLSRPVEEGGVGLGPKGFAWIIPINVGAFVGCNTFGWISDRFGRRPVFVIYLLAMAVLVWFFGHARDLTTVLVLGPFIGFFGTGFYSGFGAIFSEIFPTRARGTAQGFCYNVGRGVSAIAPPLVGFIAGLYGYGHALITVAVFAIAAAIVVMTLPETKGKQLEI